MKMLVTVILFILFVSACSANSTLILRSDMEKGSKPYLTAVFLTPSIEFWAYGPSSDYPSYEIGRVWPVHTGRKSEALVGGYAAYWPTTGKFFAEPYATANIALTSKVKLAGEAALYLPINGGPVVLTSNEISLQRTFGQFKTGLASTFWSERQIPCRVRVGGTTSWKQFQLRYLLPHSGAPAQWRLATTVGF